MRNRAYLWDTLWTFAEVFGKIQKRGARYDKKQELHGKVCDTLAVLTLSTWLRSAGGDLGDHSKALEFMLKALEIQERVFPANHPYNKMCCGNIGVTCLQLGEMDKASEYLKRSGFFDGQPG